MKIVSKMTAAACAIAVAVAVSSRERTAIGVPVLEHEARTVSGGECVDYPATTSCSIDSRCAVINCDKYSNNPGTETFDTSYDCGVYQGSSCGVYAVTKTCSGS